MAKASSSRQRTVPPAAEDFIDQRSGRKTLQNEVYVRMREGLMSGRFVPGTKLTIRDLASKLGTSPMPVREALRRLTSEGALEPLPSGATRVPLLDLARLQEITQIRMAVEGLAVRRSAERCSDIELREISTLNTAMITAINKKDARREALTNEQFHFAIYRAARSDDLLKIIENLWLKIGPFIGTLLEEYTHNEVRTAKAAARHHHALLDALRRRDSDAAERALRADIAQGAVFLSARAAKSLALRDKP